MIEHTSKRFGADLEQVRSMFLRMGGIVESIIIDAVDSVNTGNIETISRVLDREKEVNAIEIELDAMIAEVMATQQPAAVDLRLLVSLLKMITDMERSGDEAEKIAKMARRLHEHNTRFEPLVEMRHIGNLVVNMLHKLLDAFARNDAIMAAEVVRADKQVDKEWKAVLRSISSYMIEDPRLVSEGIDLMFIARALERIGDHAKNMGERVIYLVQGEDVRHSGTKYAEQVARGEAPGEEEESA